MCVLAISKLQNIEAFSNVFLGYDLLAKRWLPYAYIYPFAEGNVPLGFVSLTENLMMVGMAFRVLLRTLHGS